MRRKAILLFLQVSWGKNSEDNPVAGANLDHQTQLVMKLEIIGPLFPQHLWFPSRRAQRTFIRSTKGIWEHEFLWTCKSFYALYPGGAFDVLSKCFTGEKKLKSDFRAFK